MKIEHILIHITFFIALLLLSTVMYTLEQSSSLEVVANMSISSIREEKNKTLLLFLVMF
jgi:hypothetical protein